MERCEGAASAEGGIPSTTIPISSSTLASASESASTHTPLPALTGSKDFVQTDTTRSIGKGTASTSPCLGLIRRSSESERRRTAIWHDEAYVLTDVLEVFDCAIPEKQIWPICYAAAEAVRKALGIAGHSRAPSPMSATSVTGNTGSNMTPSVGGITPARPLSGSALEIVLKRVARIEVSPYAITLRGDGSVGLVMSDKVVLPDDEDEEVFIAPERLGMHDGENNSENENESGYVRGALMHGWTVGDYEKALTYSLSFTLWYAASYNLSDDVEPDLSATLSDLMQRMAQDDPRERIGVLDVIEACENYRNNPEEADLDYEASVCEMVEDTFKMGTVLQKWVGGGRHESHEYIDNAGHPAKDLKVGAWKKIAEEISGGVTLKKADSPGYRKMSSAPLNKFNSVMAQLKIKPTLKKVEERVLAPKVKKLSAREQLLEDLKATPRLRHVSRISKRMSMGSLFDLPPLALRGDDPLHPSGNYKQLTGSASTIVGKTFFDDKKGDIGESKERERISVDLEDNVFSDLFSSADTHEANMATALRYSKTMSTMSSPFMYEANRLDTGHDPDHNIGTNFKLSTQRQISEPFGASPMIRRRRQTEWQCRAYKPTSVDINTSLNLERKLGMDTIRSGQSLQREHSPNIPANKPRQASKQCVESQRTCAMISSNEKLQPSVVESNASISTNIDANKTEISHMDMVCREPSSTAFSKTTSPPSPTHVLDDSNSRKLHPITLTSDSSPPSSGSPFCRECNTSVGGKNSYTGKTPRLTNNPNSIDDDDGALIANVSSTRESTAEIGTSDTAVNMHEQMTATTGQLVEDLMMGSQRQSPLNRILNCSGMPEVSAGVRDTSQARLASPEIRSTTKSRSTYVLPPSDGNTLVTGSNTAAPAKDIRILTTPTKVMNSSVECTQGPSFDQNGIAPFSNAELEGRITNARNNTNAIHNSDSYIEPSVNLQIKFPTDAHHSTHIKKKSSERDTNLNLSEARHIAQVYAEMELTNLENDKPKVYKEVQAGRLCGCCREKEFGTFFGRGQMCYLCIRKTCGGCINEQKVGSKTDAMVCSTCRIEVLGTTNVFD
eukprot:CFRG6072T1